MKKSSRFTLAGVWFYQTIHGHQLAVYGSYFSGKERIWLDDELVSEKNSMKLRSRHGIDIEGQTYEIDFGFKSIWALLLGEFSLDIHSQGETLFSGTKAMLTRKQTMVAFLASFIAGGLAGYLLAACS